jgi:hypothetical protein
MAWSGAITLRAAGDTDAGVVQSFTSPSFTPAANSLLIAQCWAVSASSATTSPDMTATSSGGLTFTKYQSTVEAWGSGHGRMAVFVAAVGGSPAAQTVTIDIYPGTQTAHAAYAVYDVTNAALKQAPAFNITNFNGASGTLPLTTGTLAAAATNGNPVLAGFGKHTTSTSGFATPTGFTVLVAQTRTYAANCAYHRTDFAATSVTCSDLGESVYPAAGYVLELESPAAGDVFVGSAAITAAYAGTTPLQSVNVGATPVWP